MNINHKKRLITHIYDPVTHDIISVAEQLDDIDESDFFRKRRLIEYGIRGYLCSVCYQPVALRSNTQRTIAHYKHKHINAECPLQEQASTLSKEEILAMKFNGQKEGKAHRESKEFIHNAISKDRNSKFSKCKVEETFRDQNEDPNEIMSKEWRIPDVSALYNHSGQTKSVVFELQMSTTFISVIVAREQFYQRNNTFVVWVLLDFDGKRFTDLDIAYGNNVNVFLLSREAKEKTIETGELWFDVHWREPHIDKDELRYEWKNELVPFSSLTFHDYYLKVYYKDIELLEGELKAKLTLNRKKANPNVCSNCKKSTENIFIDGKKHCSLCLTIK
ncbi:DUF6035 family protein [Vibrio aestuarianus]|uniref:Competence protein CoiA n=1 Tax=Vibrio aestuarianus TaxID=28171 RepID=A0A9X4FB08_9VIBR|nr:DUF6035 family protein [Vibrio aestuarianus]MDE1347768.1 competence protein CoiA [Vibrio aestuarianus]